MARPGDAWIGRAEFGARRRFPHRRDGARNAKSRVDSFMTAAGRHRGARHHSSVPGRRAVTCAGADLMRPSRSGPCGLSSVSRSFREEASRPTAPAGAAKAAVSPAQTRKAMRASTPTASRRTGRAGSSVGRLASFVAVGVGSAGNGAGRVASGSGRPAARLGRSDRPRPAIPDGMDLGVGDGRRANERSGRTVGFVRRGGSRHGREQFQQAGDRSRGSRRRLFRRGGRVSPCGPEIVRIAPGVAHASRTRSSARSHVAWYRRSRSPASLASNSVAPPVASCRSRSVASRSSSRPSSSPTSSSNAARPASASAGIRPSTPRWPAHSLNRFCSFQCSSLPRSLNASPSGGSIAEHDR